MYPPKRINELHLPRPTAGNAEPDAKPMVRIDLEPATSRHYGKNGERRDFRFDAVAFDLVSDGPSIRFARYPALQSPMHFPPGMVLFGTDEVALDGHAQMWCEDGRVSCKFCDLFYGSDPVGMTAGFCTRLWISLWNLFE